MMSGESPVSIPEPWPVGTTYAVCDSPEASLPANDYCDTYVGGEPPPTSMTTPAAEVAAVRAEQSLPVTGGDVAGLAAIGVALVIVGGALRSRARG